jgi:hypothetical protein
MLSPRGSNIQILSSTLIKTFAFEDGVSKGRAMIDEKSENPRSYTGVLASVAHTFIPEFSLI